MFIRTYSAMMSHKNENVKYFCDNRCVYGGKFIRYNLTARCLKPLNLWKLVSCEFAPLESGLSLLFWWIRCSSKVTLQRHSSCYKFTLYDTLNIKDTRSTCKQFQTWLMILGVCWRNSFDHFLHESYTFFEELLIVSYM